MMTRRFALTLTVAGALASTTAALAMEPLPKDVPAPADNKPSLARIELGKKLYFDPRLSLDGTVSCNSCHNVMAGGDDNRRFSAGVKAQLGGRSAPTVWNAAFMSVQFWDGRAPSLEEQAKGPITNPIEMTMPNHDAAIARLREIPGYVEEFGKVFGSKSKGAEAASSITIDNVAKAIASYERTLVTPDSPVDLYLKGNKKALKPAQIRGMELVKSVGCLSCHSGPNYAGPKLPVGTGFFQKFPVNAVADYETKYGLSKDPGRFEVTKNEADRNFWRVPTWRNVALTAPYFHNGSVATLDEAVRVMAKTQLNKELKDNEVADIVEFLKGLTGKFPKQTLPVLPPTEGRSLAQQ